MKSLCKQDRLDEAMGLLRELQGSNAEGKAIATATLVHALCKKGCFDDAVVLVEEFGAAEAYEVWTMNLVASRKLDAAVKFLRSKKEMEGYRPEYVHYNKLVFELLQKNQLVEAYDVLVEMMEDGIVPSRGTTNVALCFFCKAGMVDVAIQLYHSRHELGIKPSKWVYNHMMSALCRNGTVEEVCQVLEESMLEGYFPGKQAFGMLANMLCREGKVKKLHELLESTREKAVKPTTAVLARCISTLCRQGELEKAWSIRHIFGGGNVDLGRFKYVYAGLIRAFISLRKVDALPGLIIQMQESGHTPSRNLYMAVVGSLCELDKFGEVLDLLNTQLELLTKKLDLEVTDPTTFYNYFIDGAAHAKKLEMAMEVFKRMERAGVKPTVNTKIILLRGYLKSRMISKAIHFFSYLCSGREPNTRLYNIFISGLCEAGHVERAMESWDEMRRNGMLPSLQCYEELVLALCSARDYDTVVKVLEDFRETGRPISAFICNVLLLHTLKGKELLKAWVDFKKAEAGRGTSGSGLLLGELIAAFSGGIRMKGNLQNLEEDIERSFPVDIYTYNMLLRGLTMAGRMDCACDLFYRIHRKGYEPNLWTYDIIVHGFCRQGNRKEAERWIDEMYRNGFCPTKYTMRHFYNTV